MTRLVLISLSALGLLAALAASPAEAQSRRELAARLDAVEARLAQVETRALQGDPVAETLMMRVDDLERQQRVQTGEIERLNFENRRLRQELEQLGVNVDRLFSGGSAYDAGNGQAASGGDPLSLGGPSDLLTSDEIDESDPYAQARASTVQPLGASGQQTAPRGPSLDTRSQSGAQAQLNADVSSLAAPPEPVMDADTLFETANARLLDGDFGGARELLRDFTQTYPEDQKVGQAWYWLGETHFINGDFQDAADSYIASLQEDRQGPRAPDALVRLGASLAALGETNRACQVLATFPSEFPRAGEDARRKAQRETSRIGCR
ncbi:tol-pal system protein YbgF [Oceanicaulis sp. LC35]|uniref:tol-pal system protein YbgF n=1 Tax=Oceanicaulis sp. LC35 TaxID=3349635 RepID=UPI003F87F713